MRRASRGSTFFFFNDTATTEIYTLSLHDALPILGRDADLVVVDPRNIEAVTTKRVRYKCGWTRSEEHTSELQSPCNLVCRLLLEKKKTSRTTPGCAPCTARSTARALAPPGSRGRS